MQILQKSKIIPVLSIEDSKTCLELARAIIEGGIEILEITLRTEAALEAISMISKEFPNALVGAGTVINAKQLESVKKAGASFAISPGLNCKFLKEARDIDIALIPGIASAGELMLALEFGYENLKFFPAEAIGGIKALKALAGPFKQVKFCPTGGISLANMNEYLALENVLCVGTSYLSDQKIIKEQNWQELKKRSKELLANIKA
ncbi:keto-deoxy-phosphogluconate aldolase [Campylobacter sp. MIT 99-7217]|uniref:bifunctional 4-hydroxy-2-oxoglutarate aldolase/2-dehydro-3-deoxy-phosphogluconate aldolase n=1 Tax=Campylobacter sp. MIT 99-7217 TaxID=535091 RepID=UPI001157298E|nr:bifunctional 4-hydroxy-2-oxoglutarate aldolase/2-dehydro-3-deoxy-phosphogluconate aldolase [Campylobacter sp. MIT 99-7217]TQR32320.1 keto-deoxy-phosphogluconate aldolase [Campylobacter sp. MIT 99-7217]